MNGDVDSNLLPTPTSNRDLGSSSKKWKDLHLSGTLYATAISGVTSISANVTGDLTGNVTGNVTGDLTGNADSATQLQTARNIGGVSFNGTADINLPGVNTAGNQDTSGTAAYANDINIDEVNGNTDYQVTFTETNNTGYNRQVIDSDNNHFQYNPSTNLLKNLSISCSTITATTFGTSSQNAYGARTVNTSNPSGGSDGDIHYKI
jgi:hypothetical protein